MNNSEFVKRPGDDQHQIVLREDLKHLRDAHPDRGPLVPAMITAQERNALYQLATQYTGAGAIIDAGCFLGASTVALATGVRDSGLGRNANTQKVIHSYDIGTLPERKNPKAAKTKLYGDFEYTFGNSFVPELKRNIEDYSDLVQLHIGDILTKQWSGDPIEICFLDICKTVSIDAHTAEMFFSSFIPGKTILIQQDYFFHRLPWIKTTLGALAEHFQWEGRVAHSSIYRCITTPGATTLNHKLFEQSDVDTLLKLHQAPEPALLDERARLKLKISEMYLLALKEQKTRALQGLKDITQQFQDEIERWDEQARSGIPSSDGVASASAMLEQAQRQIERDHVSRVSW